MQFDPKEGNTLREDRALATVLVALLTGAIDWKDVLDGLTARELEHAQQVAKKQMHQTPDYQEGDRHDQARQ